MSTKPRTPDQTSSFTSWKLDLIKAANAASDEANRIKPGPFRFLVRIIEAMDSSTWDVEAGTCEAWISDLTIADEVHGNRNRHTPQDHREALRAAGWLSYDPGVGRRATHYVVSDRHVNGVFDEWDLARERREELRQARKKEFRDGVERRQSSNSRRGESQPKTPIETGANAAERGGNRPRTHLSISPDLTLPEQDESQQGRRAGQIAKRPIPTTYELHDPDDEPPRPPPEDDEDDYPPPPIPTDDDDGPLDQYRRAKFGRDPE